MQESSSTSDSSGAERTATPTWMARAAAVWRGAPVLRWTAIFLCAAELVVVVFAPLLLPDSFYLRLYLGADSRRNMRRLLEGPEQYLSWDSLTGWRNRPNAGRGSWQVDANGARTTQRSRQEPAGRRVWFFGDSTVNGGTAVSGEETLSAFVEDSRVSSINYGTMLFGLDQCYLLMRHLLERTSPAAVVVGISENSLQALGNRFVPFRRRNETNMPFLKPKFDVRGASLELAPNPARAAYYDLLGKATLLRDLAETDEYFRNFSAYRRFGFLPISGSMWTGYEMAENGWAAASGEPLASPRLLALMRGIESDARDKGAATVFVLLPSLATTSPTGIRRRFPDRHAALTVTLAGAGFKIIDGRDALRRSGAELRDLFAADGVHYTPEGNRVIAVEVRRALEESGIGQ